MQSSTSDDKKAAMDAAEEEEEEEELIIDGPLMNPVDGAREAGTMTSFDV